jgi:heme-degrading monooxygenase HmoA
MPGYESHELKKCVEKTDQYLLLVKWDSVESHEQGFRAFPDYQRWKQLLHHFYYPFPEVVHYTSVTLD